VEQTGRQIVLPYSNNEFNINTHSAVLPQGREGDADVPYYHWAS